MAGKRQFRRTTSMTGITVDFEEPAGPPLGFQISPITGDPVLMDLGSGGRRDHSLMAAMVSPRHNRRRNNYPTDNNNNNNSNDWTETTAHFLRTCGLCQRRLAPGRDIYMYRGDTAFCSLECREQQMKHDDERKNNCFMVAPNSSSMPNEEYHHHHHGNYSETSTATSDASGGKTETFAAA